MEKQHEEVCPLVCFLPLLLRLLRLPLLSLRPPLARLNKQPRLGGDTLTVTALDVPVFRALSARLINTSFSFNGAAALQPSQRKRPFIWVIYGSSWRSSCTPRERRDRPSRAEPSRAGPRLLSAGALQARGKLIGLYQKKINK